jgi:hypothetical protein
MKKIYAVAVAAFSMAVVSCGIGTAGSSTSTQGRSSDVLGSVIAGASNPETIGNVIQSVLGLDKLTQQTIIGTWNYAQPGCAFTSENLLAKAGGEAAATTIKQKLQSSYQMAGISSGNTQVTFNQDGTFRAVIAGKAWSGKYTFDTTTGKVTMQGLLLSINCYVKKNSNGIGLLFEASKLLQLLQTVAALSGNSTLQSVGSLAKNYDGLRIGFDMKK